MSLGTVVNNVKQKIVDAPTLSVAFAVAIEMDTPGVNVLGFEDDFAHVIDEKHISIASSDGKSSVVRIIKKTYIIGLCDLWTCLCHRSLFMINKLCLANYIM